MENLARIQRIIATQALRIWDITMPLGDNYSYEKQLLTCYLALVKT